MDTLAKKGYYMFETIAVADKQSSWARGGVYFHRHWTIACVEENGRRFFSTNDPDPIGLTLAQEFGSVSDAMSYINEREIKKMLYRVSGGSYREA